MRKIELEESRTITIRFSYVLDRRAACCTQTIRQVQLASHFSHRNFGARVIDPVDANRSESDRCSYFVAKDCGSCVALVGVNEHTGDDAVAIEGLAIGGVCVRLASVGGGVVPAAEGKLFLC